MTENKKGLLALSPLLVFIVLYLVTSIISGDFYKVPITVAFMASSIFAIAISGGYPLAKRIEIYSKGASTDNMMMMLWIFVLAGAFANSAKDMGSIDATVNLTLSVLPDNMLLPGLFLAACFISMSIGTSVGTIVALTPIAAGIATSTVVAGKVKDWLKANGYSDSVQVFQSKVAEEVNRIDDYDVVISTTVVPDSIKDKVIMGLPLLTGMGLDALWSDLKSQLEA